MDLEVFISSVRKVTPDTIQAMFYWAKFPDTIQNQYFLVVYLHSGAVPESIKRKEEQWEEPYPENGFIVNEIFGSVPVELTPMGKWQFYADRLIELSQLKHLHRISGLSPPISEI